MFFIFNFKILVFIYFVISLRRIYLFDGIDISMRRHLFLFLVLSVRLAYYLLLLPLLLLLLLLQEEETSLIMIIQKSV